MGVDRSFLRRIHDMVCLLQLILSTQNSTHWIDVDLGRVDRVWNCPGISSSPAARHHRRRRQSFGRNRRFHICRPYFPSCSLATGNAASDRRIAVRNLSRGATAADGIAMANQVTSDDHIVLVEIGGNDLIAGLPSDQFAKSLDSMLSKLASKERTVVMMELPLLPYRIGYGRVQRQLASKYGVWLIPKRYLVQVISGSSATSDGLHLSGEGSRRMATLVARVLSPVLKPNRTR